MEAKWIIRRGFHPGDDIENEDVHPLGMDLLNILDWRYYDSRTCHLVNCFSGSNYSTPYGNAFNSGFDEAVQFPPNSIIIQFPYCMRSYYQDS